MKNLHDKKVAILATDGFEEIELTAPKEELTEYGVTVHVVADKPKIRSWKNRQWGNEIEADRLLDRINVMEYNALILPGGVINADRLRRNSKAIDLIKEFHEKEKVIGAICHGPQLLIEANMVKGKTMTAFHSIKTDMKNAGARYEDLSVSVDDNLITAQSAEDTSAFLKKFVGVLKVVS